MTVTLLQSYPDESVAYRASGICIGKEGSEKGMKSALSQGHMSIIEHLPMTFEIRGISRACSHQLVRHRLASYSQESQRYVKNIELSPIEENTLYTATKVKDIAEDTWTLSRMTSAEDVIALLEKFFVIPETIKMGSRRELSMYLQTLAINLQQYIYMSETPDEDARFLLPNAMKTNIIVSCNARSFIEQCNERLCEQAQWEIRDMYKAMRETIKDVYPTVYSYAKPKCARCKETRPCTRKSLTKDEKIEHVHLRG